MKYIYTVLTMILLSSCSAINVEQYSSNNPELDLFEYFIGETKGYGIVQDRKGVLTRQFTVDIIGTVETNGSLKLFEKFDWADGEKSTRTWIISKDGKHLYSGTAEDVATPAEGAAYGNALNWQYVLNVAADDTTWKIKFDDWMFLVTDKVLINRVKMSKFGLTVGEVTIAFQK